MYNSQYYTCEEIDQRLLQGYLDDYNTENNTSLTKAQFLSKLGSILSVWQGVDDEPIPESERFVKSGGITKVYGKYVENPEFVYVKTDDEDKILWAIKADGDIYFGCGVPKQVIAYINERIAELSLDEYEDIVAFLDDLEKDDKTLQDLLDEKVDKVEGKSLIDAEYAEGVHYIENPEFAAVWLDNDDHILFGVQIDGNFLFGCGVPRQVKEYIEQKIEELPLYDIVNFIGDYLNNTTLEELLSKKADEVYMDNPEFIEAKTDEDGKLIEAIKADGRKYLPAGVDLDAAEAYKECSPEYIDVKIDSECKVLEGTRTDGTKVIGGDLEVNGEKGIEAAFLKLKEAGLVELVDNLKPLLELLFDRKTIVLTVKKDGTGDFISIQDAINSITDASEKKQYEIHIYDDHISTAFTDLHYMNNPYVRISGESDINTFVSFVTTKNWIHIVGIGGKKKIWFINPNIDMAGNLFQYVHVVYAQGNVRLENLDIRIQGGRYAIHQDKTGITDDSNPDINAFTHYKNCHIEHLGNDMYTNGSSWRSDYSLAVCPSSGGTIKVEGCYIRCKKDPLICHLNQNYKKKATYILERSTVVCTNPNLSLDNIGSYMSDFGTNQNNDLIMIGCNIPHLNGSGKGLNGYDVTSLPTDNRQGGIFVSGYGNEKAYIQYHGYHGISFRSASLNSQINVVGGSAKSLIFGDNPIVFHGDAKNYGFCVGNLGISINGDTVNGVSSYIRSLPYLLGNCANNPKTLIIDVDGTQHTITFNENYMTSDGSPFNPRTTPAISGTDIISGINNTFSEYFTIVINSNQQYSKHPNILKLYSFSDCIEYAVNTSNEAWKPWQCVKRSYDSGVKEWRLALEGEIPDGIVGERIDAPYDGKYSEGVIILANKAIFGVGTNTKYQNVNAPKGTRLSVGADSYLVQSQSSNAPFVIISDNGTFIFNV